jgi:hypothetical protein
MVLQLFVHSERYPQVLPDFDEKFARFECWLDHKLVVVDSFERYYSMASTVYQ